VNEEHNKLKNIKKPTFWRKFTSYCIWIGWRTF